MNRVVVWAGAALFLALSAAGASAGYWLRPHSGAAAGVFSAGLYSEKSASGVVKAPPGGVIESTANSDQPVELPGEREAAGFGAQLREGSAPNPAEAENLLQSAQSAAQRDENWDAYSKARDALRLGADDPAAWMLFAEAARRTDNKDEAAIAAFSALTRTKEDGVAADIYRFLGALYEAQGEEAAAAAVYRAAIKKRPDRDLGERLARLTGQKLYYVRDNVVYDADEPELCLTFSWALREDGDSHYENYLRLSKPIKFSAYVSGRDLCLGGFAHGQNVRVTILKGLPAQSGAKLAADVSLEANFEDRPPRLAFNDRAYILPRIRSAGVPLTAINLSRAKLELYRINDRNLVPQFEQGQPFEQLWGYSARQIAQSSGEKVWSGFMSFDIKRNRALQAAAPIDEMLPERAPGLYVLTAQPDKADERDWAQRATQWLIVTDIGLSVLSNADGLSAIARSYAKAGPLAGVKLALIARNNSVLGEAVTDSEGRARFAPGLSRGVGGAEPRLLLAYGRKGEFTFIDLGQPGFDLSDRGVGGRAPPKSLDAFMYTDRGIYRPGETSPVRLGVLLRDDKGDALAAPPPLSLRVFRPDGAEAERRVLQPEPGSPSAYFADITLPAAARTGAWSAALYVPGREGASEELSRIAFDVEDFVPARLELTLAHAPAAFSGPAPLKVDVNAQYLYGAPGADLSGQAAVRVRRVEAPFEKYKGFHFGLLDQTFNDVSREIPLSRTDATGALSFAAKLPDLPASSLPLEAFVSATVFEEGGRPISRGFIAPIARDKPFIGLRVRDGDSVALDRSATIEALAADWRGARTALSGLRYRIVREDGRYVWSRNDDNWSYRYTPRDVPVASGGFEIRADQIATLATPVLKQWGTYRVEIYDPRDGAERQAAASVRFYAGWRDQEVGEQSPDALSVIADKAQYQPGDVARILVKAPFGGAGELTLARESVLQSLRFDLPKDGSGVVLSVPVRADWGPGVYAIARAFRPSLGPSDSEQNPKVLPVSLDSLQGPALPGRAVGLAWLGVDPASRSLSVSLTAPAEIRPRQSVKLPIAVAGAGGESVVVTLAAVDEGVLQLTGFETPDPVKFLFGKRRLGLDLRDSYGKLIDPRWNVIGKLSAGGDAAARQSGQLPDRWIKPLALFSGLVTLDRAGRSVISLDLPEFQGKMRLMAVAASRHKVGSAEAKVIVRDPVVVNGSPPRFMAPGDEAYLTLTFHNVAGPAGDAQMAISADGPIKIEALPTRLTLKAGEKVVRQVRLSASDVGSGRIKLSFTPPGGPTRPDIVWPISVRPAGAFETRVVLSTVPPGGQTRVDGGLLKAYYRGNASAAVSLATAPNLDFAGLVNGLDRYAYGCLEQTVSRALPLLYLDEVANAAGVTPKDAASLKATLDEAIDRVLAMQTPEGGFGLWGASDAADEWLTAYALEFLIRAKGKGFAAGDRAAERAAQWLTRALGGSDFAPPALARRAYAFYALMQADRALKPSAPYLSRGELAYFADVYGAKLPDALAQAMLASALAQVGDTGRAARLWSDASANARRIAQANGEYPAWTYGDPLRDLAGFVAILAETPSANPAEVEAMARALSDRRRNASLLSTQDMAWLMRAAHALLARGGTMDLAVNGQSVAAKSAYGLGFSNAHLGELDKGLVFANHGKTPLYQSVSITAVPRDADQRGPAGRGMAITRTLYRLDGSAADRQNLKQNDLVVVVLDVKVERAPSGEVLVADLLPAGLEIENTRLFEGHAAAQLPWLSGLATPLNSELRDDRYVAGVRVATQGAPQVLRLAYLARAVTPGRYRTPAPYVEDMYRPEFFGRGAAEITGVTRP